LGDIQVTANVGVGWKIGSFSIVINADVVVMVAVEFGELALSGSECNHESVVE
jgi:hypothetical protein